MLVKELLALSERKVIPLARHEEVSLPRLGRRAEAIEEYRRALADQPDHVPARQALRALGES